MMMLATTSTSTIVRAQTQVVVGVAVVINEDNEILLTHRSEPALPEADDTWELPGGRVEHGESPAEAATREVAEETGYRVEVDLSRVALRSRIWAYPNLDAHTIVIAYRARLSGGKPVIESGGKVTALRWYRPSALPDRLLGETTSLVNELLA